MRDIMRERELASHYALSPSPEIAAEMQDIYARMARVVTPPDWAIYAPM